MEILFYNCYVDCEIHVDLELKSRQYMHKLRYDIQVKVILFSSYSKLALIYELLKNTLFAEKLSGHVRINTILNL